MESIQPWVFFFDFNFAQDRLFQLEISERITNIVNVLKSSLISNSSQYGIIKAIDFYGFLAMSSVITKEFKAGEPTLNLRAQGLGSDLPQQYLSPLCTCGTHNISSQEEHQLEYLAGLNELAFECIFVPRKVGMRRPERRFYKYLLDSTRTQSSRVIFFEQNHENALAARSLGAHGILLKSHENFERRFLNIIGDPVKRGLAFLANSAKKIYSVTNNGLTVRDNFSQLLIYELMQDKSLVDLEPRGKTWNFFIGGQDLIPGDYPDDIDTTSLALLILPYNPTAAREVIEETLNLINPDGIFQIYFERNRPRTDSAVCVNILRFFYKYGEGEHTALKATKDWVYQTLLYRTYLDGTRYYASPEIFLFYLSQLVADTPNSNFCDRIVPILSERLRERVNIDGNGVDLSMRILAFKRLGLKDTLFVERERLLGLQELDGGWEIGWYCRTGKDGIQIGNRGLTTALAIRALS